MRFAARRSRRKAPTTDPPLSLSGVESGSAIRDGRGIPTAHRARGGGAFANCLQVDLVRATYGGPAPARVDDVRRKALPAGLGCGLDTADAGPSPATTMRPMADSPTETKPTVCGHSGTAGQFRGSRRGDSRASMCRWPWTPPRFLPHQRRWLRQAHQPSVTPARLPHRACPPGPPSLRRGKLVHHASRR